MKSRVQGWHYYFRFLNCLHSFSVVVVAGFICIATPTAPKLHFGEPESGGNPTVSTVVFKRRLTG